MLTESSVVRPDRITLDLPSIVKCLSVTGRYRGNVRRGSAMLASSAYAALPADAVDVSGGKVAESDSLGVEGEAVSVGSGVDWKSDFDGDGGFR